MNLQLETLDIKGYGGGYICIVRRRKKAKRRDLDEKEETKREERIPWRRSKRRGKKKRKREEGTAFHQGEFRIPILDGSSYNKFGNSLPVRRVLRMSQGPLTAVVIAIKSNGIQPSPLSFTSPWASPSFIILLCINFIPITSSYKLRVAVSLPYGLK